MQLPITNAGWVSVDSQRQTFLDTVFSNPVIPKLLERISGLNLKDWYLAGGCLFQTVWNHQHGFAPTHGILDYDLLYFDDQDLSSKAEDCVTSMVRCAVADLPIEVEVCNQARVHLWYGQRFGATSAPFVSCEDGIAAFLAPCCSVGVRRVGDEVEVCAPCGFDDLFGMVVRPSPRRYRQGASLRGAYEEKAARWKALWPKLQVVSWA